MVNEYARTEMASVLDQVQQQLRTIAQVHQERTGIVGAATARRYVTVSVDADGRVIETKFGAGVEELTYGDIAKAVTEATQRAACDAQRRADELMEPVQQQRARLPQLTDLIDGMPDPDMELPTEPEVAMVRTDRADGSVESKDFADVETRQRSGASRARVADSSW